VYCGDRTVATAVVSTKPTLRYQVVATVGKINYMYGRF